MTVSARNKTYIGGLVGTNLLPTSGSTKSKISNSTADVEINVTQSLTTTYEVEICVGGFIGVNQTIVENSISQSKIKVSTDKLNTTDTVKYFVSVGGFVGTLNSTALINGCAVITDLDYSSKNVEIASIGGISGKIFGNSKVTNSLIIANGSKLVSNITTTLPEDSTKTLELVASEVVASTETNKYVTAYVLGNLTTDFSSVNNVIASNNITDISTLQLSANVLTFVNSKK